MDERGVVGLLLAQQAREVEQHLSHAVGSGLHLHGAFATLLRAIQHRHQDLGTGRAIDIFAVERDGAVTLAVAPEEAAGPTGEARSEERRGGKEGCRKWRWRRVPDRSKKKSSKQKKV